MLTMNRSVPAMIIGGLALLASVSVAVLGMGEPIKSGVRSPHEDWMGALPDDTKIQEMSIPGSHCSLSLYGFADLFGRRQSMDVAEQMRAGVRFLDLRFRYSDEGLTAHDGVNEQRSSFPFVIKKIVSFLNDHPKETLFVRIGESGTHHDLFEEKVKEHVTETSFYLDNVLPETLGKARGKAVLLTSYEKATIGIDFEKTYLYQNVDEVPSVEDKLARMEECASSDHPYKGNSSGASKVTTMNDYASFAKEMNTRLPSFFQSHDLRGVTLMDYVTSDLLDAYFEVTL